jgi:hypothetical protein
MALRGRLLAPGCPAQRRVFFEEGERKGHQVSDDAQARQGEINADIEAMYRAGTREMPTKAAQLAEVAGVMSSAILEANGQLAKMGFPGAGSDLIEILAESRAGVVAAVQTLNDMGAAVVDIADDFVARDSEASAYFTTTMDDAFKVGNRQVPVPHPLPELAAPPPYDGEIGGDVGRIARGGDV